MVTISIRLDKKTIEKLDQSAKADHRSRNNLIGYILSTWLRTQEAEKQK